MDERRPTKDPTERPPVAAGELSAAAPGRASPAAGGAFPDVLSLIPHRPPFVWIDRVLALGPESAAAERLLGSADPGSPGFEPLLIEGMAQTAAVLCGHRLAGPPGTPPPLGMLVGVKQMALLAPPRAGDRLRFEVEVVRRLRPFTLVRARTLRGSQVLAEGELKFYLPAEAAPADSAGTA